MRLNPQQERGVHVCCVGMSMCMYPSIDLKSKKDWVPVWWQCSQQSVLQRQTVTQPCGYNLFWVHAHWPLQQSFSGQWQLRSPLLRMSWRFDNLHMPIVQKKFQMIFRILSAFCSVLFTLSDCVLNNKLWPLAIFLRMLMMRTHSSKSAGQWNKINQEFPKYNNIYVH